MPLKIPNICKISICAQSNAICTPSEWWLMHEWTTFLAAHVRKRLAWICMQHAQHTHTNSHKSPQDQHHQIESNRKRARAARTSSQRFTNQAMLILYILDFRRAQAYFSTNNITEDTVCWIRHNVWPHWHQRFRSTIAAYNKQQSFGCDDVHVDQVYYTHSFIYWSTIRILCLLYNPNLRNGKTIAVKQTRTQQCEQINRFFYNIYFGRAHADARARSRRWTSFCRIESLWEHIRKMQRITALSMLKVLRTKLSPFRHVHIVPFNSNNDNASKTGTKILRCFWIISWMFS